MYLHLKAIFEHLSDYSLKICQLLLAWHFFFFSNNLSAMKSLALLCSQQISLVFNAISNLSPTSLAEYIALYFPIELSNKNTPNAFHSIPWTQPSSQWWFLHGTHSSSPNSLQPSVLKSSTTTSIKPSSLPISAHCPLEVLLIGNMRHILYSALCCCFHGGLLWPFN